MGLSWSIYLCLYASLCYSAFRNQVRMDPVDCELMRTMLSTSFTHLTCYLSPLPPHPDTLHALRAAHFQDTLAKDANPKSENCSLHEFKHGCRKGAAEIILIASASSFLSEVGVEILVLFSHVDLDAFWDPGTPEALHNL